MYEIQSKSDFNSGATLVVKIPEADVDKTALYTILSDRPDFLLPFHHRAVDGQVEFTYYIENRTKLTYLAAQRQPADYAVLWNGILQPLIDCSDWFMDPYAFVLISDYLYCDSNGKVISYAYIPSVKPVSDDTALKNMVTEIAKQNRVTDSDLETKVAWALHDFNPVAFLQIFKPYLSNLAGSSSATQSPIPASPAPSRPIPAPHQPAAVSVPAPTPAPVSASAFDAQPPHQPLASHQAAPPAVMTPQMPAVSGAADDIVINFPADGISQKLPKSKPGKPAKAPKADKHTAGSKPRGGLFGSKKNQQDIIQGAAAAPQPGSTPQPYGIPGGQPGIYAPPAPAPQPGPPFVPAMNDIEDEKTQVQGFDSGTPKLRYTGAGNINHPPVIEVNINDGEVFSIGRFDVSKQTRQSTFEFNPKTKAVSRRHAVITRKADDYYIVDVGSAAGTFVNGQKLPQSVEVKLEQNSRVSLGNMGADYIWER